MFIGKKYMTEKQYQQNVEYFMTEWGGHENICSITSDNIGLFIKA